MCKFPVFAVLLLAFTCTARTARAESHSLLYALYAGGFHVVEARLTLVWKEDRYKARLYARTRGFLGTLAPWYGTFTSEGKREGAGPLQVREHRSETTWREETEIKSYQYGPDGNFAALRITEEGRDKSPGKIDEALTRATTDALSATLEVMRDLEENRQCAGSSEVFDGERRFEMRFRHEGTLHLDPTRYNIFEGPAAICTVEVVPKGGKWHKKPRGWMSIQEQGRDQGSLPAIWLGMLEGKDLAVPVKLRVKTDYGTLFMHLIEYRDDEGMIRQMEEWHIP